MKNKIKTIGFATLAMVMLCVPALTVTQVNQALAGDYVDPYGRGYNVGDYQRTGEDAGMSSRSFSEIISEVIKWLLYMIGFLGMIIFIIAGIMYLTAGGDETKTEKAKSWIINAIIGIVVALVGLTILTLISKFLGIEL